MDAIVTIWSESNTRALTHADPERHQRLIGASQQLAKRRWQRMSAGDLGWLGVLFPTEAHAQDAQMSLAEYEQLRLPRVPRRGARRSGLRTGRACARSWAPAPRRCPRPASFGSSGPGPT